MAPYPTGSSSVSRIASTSPCELAKRHEGRLKARFAAVRVRTADGPPQRIRDMGQQHMPGEQTWLILS